ncbi:APA family basic amino acid/polyamine antiporter [Saccharothrix tamanrassetensis]|uniref:APA family basic amino acid/polyamine antiporter n=1 Tax=Saccharothrix tamanrassetensis TaxID=1051531 RepID=A0A841CU74_9PSEU|nr:amino acid permease [Saccharothrix tamanrassetensis]MBB5959864.1 APA family basic amino acid/polyamine antiporter [Saccharothrix tamanrassetensis]
MTVTPRAGAVVLALGATTGTGILLGFGPAAALAGPWFLLALALAATTALCCAFSTADQHRAYPDAPGGYAHIRNQLGPWPARIGASAHLIGRAGVAAALAGAFGAYVFPRDRVLAGLALLVATAVFGRYLRGRIGWASALVGLGVLTMVVLVCFSVAPPEGPVTTGGPGFGGPGFGGPGFGGPGLGSPGFDGVMGAAGLLFVVFTGFERITVPSHEDRAFPARVLHFAVPALIGIVFAVALAVGAAVLHQLGAARLALSPAPLRDALVAADGRVLLPVLAVGAAVAAVSSLVFVLAGARRTLLGLTETGDLPAMRAQWPLDVIGVALAASAFLLLSPATALAVGACGTALYYGFTNASARVLLQEDRTWPMRTACFGLGMSVLLAMSAPADALLVTAVGLAVGTGLFGLGRIRQPVG